MEKKYHRAYKPDAQAFDEVRFVTIDRFKESEMSGDEWRISVVMQFFRNGKIVHEVQAAGKMENAMAFAGFLYARACDDGKGYFAGEDNYCDQEGCPLKATVTYRIKERKCSSCGQKEEHYQGNDIAKFCDRHKRRGDSDLTDQDKNYEPVEE